MKLTYREKLEKANREAAATVAGLGVTVIVWAVCGFGLAGLDVQVFHTPLWVVGGTLGTWACAIAVSVVLARRFFGDFELDDEGAHGDAPGASGGVPGAPGVSGAADAAGEVRGG